MRNPTTSLLSLAVPTLMVVAGPGCGQATAYGIDAGMDSSPIADAWEAGNDSGPPDVFVPPPSCLVALECEDQNPCTQDDCIAGECAYTNVSDACNDGDPCTSNDVCLLGKCTGQALDCDDDNVCTVDSCKGAVCIHQASTEPGCELTITITHPPRAATLWAGKDTSIQGVVFSPAGMVQSATLNGLPLNLSPDGGFHQPFQPDIGVNILNALVTDSLGRTEGTVQSFLYGQWIRDSGSLEAIEPVNGSVWVWLRADVFDDDDTDDLDDLASLAWLVMDNLDLDSVIPHPLTAEGEEPGFGWCTWTVDISDVDWKVSEVDFEPVPGGVQLLVTLEDLSAYVEAIAPWCPDALGWLYADEIGGEARLTIEAMPGGALDVNLDWVDVTVKGVTVDLTGGVTSLFDWLINWFTGIFETKIEDLLETWIPEKIVPLMDGVLAGFTHYEDQFQLPAVPGNPPGQPIALAVQAAKTDFSGKGARLTLDSGTAANPVNGHASPGSIAREDCQGKQPGPFLIPAVDMVEAALHEDWLNQALHQLWSGGHMNLSVDGQTLGLDLSEFGITDLSVDVDPHLPPVATTCRSPGSVELQVGDLNLKAAFSMGGGTGGAELFGSVRVPLALDLEPGALAPKLAFAVEGIAEFGVEVVATTGAVEGFDVLFEDIMSTVVLNLLIDKILADAAASYPVPVVDLGDFVPGVPPGSNVSFKPKTLKLEKGFLLFSGEVVGP